MILDYDSILSTEWSYTTATNGRLYGFKRGLKEKEVMLQIFADSTEEYNNLLNNILSIMEKDVIEEIPGKLWINDYYLKCYITASDYEELEEDFYSTDKKIKILAERWIWIKETVKHFIHTDKPDSDGRGYPYGYDYDYTLGGGYLDQLLNSHFASCDFLLEINGYVRNPSISIGNHIYRVAETVQEYEKLSIDSRSKTIILTKNNGVAVNCFAKRDKSNYIFEKIPAGTTNVYWNSGFDFDITLYEERSEPKWI